MKEQQIFLHQFTGFEGAFPARNIEREQSPERLLALFKEISGMRTLEELTENTTDITVDVLARRGNITGAMVIGSCTDATALPEDLDVFLIAGSLMNQWTQDYVEQLKYNFDTTFSLRYKIDTSKPPMYPIPIEHGRLDLLDVISIDREISPFHERYIQTTQQPFSMAFSREDAEAISSVLQRIKGRQ